MIDVEKAKKRASQVFASPREVLEHEGLEKADKIAILEAWRYDALQLETAQTENMQSSQDSQLRDVLNALHRLKTDD